MNNTGIYKITSPTNRVYIGQSIDLKTRLRRYSKENCKLQIRLFESIKKHGFVNHIVEIIEYCNVDKLNIRERYWQDFYDVLGKRGMNCKLTKTEDRNGKHSEESKSKMRINCSYSMLGKKLSQEKRQAISERMKGNILSEETKKKISFAKKGARMSEATILKMSVSSKGIKKSKSHSENISLGKSFPVLHLTTGIFYNGIKEVSIASGINFNTMKNYLNGSRGNKTDYVRV